MNIARQLSNAGLFVIEDSQAKHRQFDAPESLPVSYLDEDDILEAVDVSASKYPTPLALILETGQVVVLTESGKGGIAVQGTEGELNEAQTNALTIVTDVLTNHFGLVAKKKRSKAAPIEPVSEPEAIDTPETVSDPVEAESDPNEAN